MAVISNYDITREKMEREFVRYDQERMIEKFQLRHTPAHLFIPFLGEEYRVGRTTGKVELCLADGAGYAPAGFNESMTIFDVLCCSKSHCRLSGQYATVTNLPKIPGGKKLIYNHIDMPLTAIDDFAEKGKTDPLFAELDKICRAHKGLWNAEAEKYLLANAKAI